MPADSARSYAVYSDAVVGAILLLKFEQIEPLGAWFAERLAEVVSAEIVGGCGGSGTTGSPTRTRARVEPGSAGLEALAKRLRLPHKAVLLMQMRARRTNKY